MNIFKYKNFLLYSALCNKLYYIALYACVLNARMSKSGVYVGL